MTEKLLQYIWQFQYFNKNELTTTEGETLTIFYPGTLNKNQGPDFLEARIIIEGRTWVGNVELHIRASGWHQHGHSDDPHYRNVVLHVVWENDRSAEGIPTLTLADRVSKMLLLKYETWMNSRLFIPCGQFSVEVSDLIFTKWKERLLAERLERKSDFVLWMLEQTRFHWEEVFWWLLARSFGMPVNADPFEEVARSVPLNILLKHRTELKTLEAILLGQARMIDPSEQQLMRDYRFYAVKYHLQPINFKMQLLRMRPASFPLRRLKQLALLIHRHGTLVSHLLADGNCKTIQKLVPAKVIINAVIPFSFTYGLHRNEYQFVEKAIDLSHALPGENNGITKAFATLGFAARTAGDSQALLELKSQYCDKRRCLDCSIGSEKLKIN